MTHTYPWYQLVAGEGVEQGDLLQRCPVIVAISSGDTSRSLEGKSLPVEVQRFDVVVMTQSCDLAQGKIADVILCPHWDLTTAAHMDPFLAGKKTPEHVRQGRHPRYALLAPSEFSEFPMSVRVVDFGRIFSLPKDLVSSHANGQGQRLRLCPPYREHLSQAFARFFMRVGLPQDIQLP